MIDQGKPRLGLGVCGSTHAALIPAYIQILQERYRLYVSCTPAATGFVSTAALRTSVGGRLYHSTGREEGSVAMHIEFALAIELLVVVPCTATTLSRITHGSGETLVAAAAMCMEPRHVVVAPAMNLRMWRSPAVQHNIRTLLDYGMRVIPPATRTARVDALPEELGASPSPRIVADWLAQNWADTGPCEVM